MMQGRQFLHFQLLLLVPLLTLFTGLSFVTQAQSDTWWFYWDDPHLLPCAAQYPVFPSFEPDSGGGPYPVHVTHSGNSIFLDFKAADMANGQAFSLALYPDGDSWSAIYGSAGNQFTVTLRFDSSDYAMGVWYMDSAGCQNGFSFALSATPPMDAATDPATWYPLPIEGRWMEVWRTGQSNQCGRVFGSISEPFILRIVDYPAGDAPADNALQISYEESGATLTLPNNTGYTGGGAPTTSYFFLAGVPGTEPYKEQIVTVRAPNATTLIYEVIYTYADGCTAYLTADWTYLGPAAGAESTSGSPSYVFVEDFLSPDEYTQTSAGVRIENGQVRWNINRSGGQQFVYRPIPTFTGNVTLLVRGQIDSATNNCRVKVGVGDNPGSGVSVNYGFLGGGCPQSGYVITADGVSLDGREDPACTYTGNWLWVTPGISYAASLSTADGIAQLAVRGIGSSVGSPQYRGPFDTLYVGLDGDGDWPSCSGAVDSVIVVAGDVPGLSNASFDPAEAERIVRAFLPGDITPILQGIEVNLSPSHRPQAEFYIPIALGYWMAGTSFADKLHDSLSRLPRCLPTQREARGSRDMAALCVEEWRRATSDAYRSADLAVRRWYEVAALEGANKVLEEFVEKLTLKLGAAVAGVAIPGHFLFSVAGAITGTLHLAHLQVLGIDALAEIARVWYADLGYSAAQDYFVSVGSGAPIAVPTERAQVAQVQIYRPAKWDEVMQFPSLWAADPFRDRTSPGSEYYNITVDGGQTYSLRFLWCSNRAADLPAIVAPLNVSFFVDGVMVPSSGIYVEDRGTCRNYGVLLGGWESKTTHAVKVVYSLSQSIFDGSNSYQAGTYVHEIAVRVK